MSFIVCITIMLQIYFTKVNIGRLVAETIEKCDQSIYCPICKTGIESFHKNFVEEDEVTPELVERVFADTGYTWPVCKCYYHTATKVIIQSFIIESRLFQIVKNILFHCCNCDDDSDDPAFRLAAIDAEIESFRNCNELIILQQNNWNLREGIENLFAVALAGDKYFIFSPGDVDENSKSLFNELLIYLVDDDTDNTLSQNDVEFELKYDVCFRCDKFHQALSRIEIDETTEADATKVLLPSRPVLKFLRNYAEFFSKVAKLLPLNVSDAQWVRHILITTIS